MPSKKIQVFIAFVLLLSITLGGCNNNMKTETLEIKTEIDYPVNALTMIVPFSPGGGLDLHARSLEKLAIKHFNQALIVVNRPGGTGTLGWNEVARAEPNGYILGVSSAELLLQPLFGDTRYQYVTALDPIAQLTSGPFIMVVNADQPWQTVDDVIQYAKQHPNELKFGHGGLGSTPHILGAAFAKAADIQIGAIPFKGGGEVVAALLGNHTQISFLGASVVKEQLKGGNLRALAVSGEKRLTDPILANIPTYKELGMDLVFTNWIGIAAPKLLPKQVKAKLEAGFKEMILDPEFTRNMANLGLEVEYLNSADSLEKWLDENKKLTELVKEMGIAEEIKAMKGLK